jgi:hypothetical protein
MHFLYHPNGHIDINFFVDTALVSTIHLYSPQSCMFDKIGSQHYIKVLTAGVHVSFFPVTEEIYKKIESELNDFKRLFPRFFK